MAAAGTKLEKASAPFPLLLIPLYAVGFYLAVGAAVLVAAYLPEGWAIIAGGLAFLLVLGVALELGTKWRGRQDRRWLARQFPGFTGERIPIFHFIGYAGPDGVLRLAPERQNFALGVSDDALFLLADRDQSRPPHERLGGSLVRVPGGGFVHVDRHRLGTIGVEELDDEAIARNAVDPADWSERFAEAAVGKLLDGGMKRKIVPMAAFVTLTSGSGEEERLLMAAVPTEVPEATVGALGGIIEGETDVAGYLLGKAKDKATEEVQGAIGNVVGGGVVDAYNEVTSLLNPGGASIGETRGARGRLMARLIAARIALARSKT